MAETYILRFEVRFKMMRTVYLYGSLARKFGKEYRVDVRTVGEALRAIHANDTRFLQEIYDLGEKGYGFSVAYGNKTPKRPVEDIEELVQLSNEDIHIIPVIAGAKKEGIGQIILGIVMIVAAVWTGGPSAAGYFSSTAAQMAVSGALMNIGVAMAIGGVVQLLAPQPKDKDKDKEKTSYLFDGAINTMAQGHPVPVGYGEMIVGSAVISAGIDTDHKDVSSDDGSGGSGGSGGSDGKPPRWTNPVTGQEEDYPPPTLVWNKALSGYVLPDGTELKYDTQMVHVGGDTGWENQKVNFKTADGRTPYLNTAPERWDIPSPTVFAKWRSSRGGWVMTNDVPISENTSAKRFETAQQVNWGSDGG